MIRPNASKPASLPIDVERDASYDLIRQVLEDELTAEKRSAAPNRVVYLEEEIARLRGLLLAVRDAPVLAEPRVYEFANEYRKRLREKMGDL